MTQREDDPTGFDKYLRQAGVMLRGERLDRLCADRDTLKWLRAEGIPWRKADLLRRGAKQISVPIGDLERASKLAERLGLPSQLIAISQALRFLEREIVLLERKLAKDVDSQASAPAE